MRWASGEDVVFAYHFFKMILDESVPVWAAISFLRSPTVSSGLHFTRTWNRSEFRFDVKKSGVTYPCVPDGR